MKYINVKKFDDTKLVKTFAICKNQARFRIYSYNKEANMQDLKYYEELAKQFDITTNDMVRIEQKHTDNILIAKNRDRGVGVIREEYVENYDGIITNEKNLMLLTIEADCTPIYILDPIKKVIGMIHSGWRGAVQKIGCKAIDLMIENYGCNKKDILIHFGPAICGKCYEVGMDLYYEFKPILECDDIHRVFVPIVEKPEKFLLDVTEAVRITLIQHGILEENITRENICTYHDDMFHSWRLEQDRSKQMLTGIMLI